MFFTFVLASVLAMSAVLGRSAIPTSRQVTYENEHKTTMQLNKTAQMVAVGDRSSNLKYVMAIQSSTIWEDIKKRSLTINTAQGLDGAVAEKSPNNLTDQELAQLKQACHDGLKCVAVDQLLVLKQVSEPLGDGKVSVRTAITKITQVLTQYTTEYHEDVYQYEAVKQSDDQSKVYESVTTIVEDNKDLCQIDLTPTTEQSQPKNGDSNTIPTAVNNTSTVTNNTIDNYNTNNGTVNSATINIDPKSSGSVDVDVSSHEKPPVDSNVHPAATDGPTVIESKNPSPDHPDVNTDHQPMALAAVNSTPAATDVPTGDGSITKVAETDSPLESTRGSETTDRPVTTTDRPITTTDDHPENAPQTTDDQPKPIGQQLMITDGPSPRNGDVSGNSSVTYKTIDNYNTNNGAVNSATISKEPSDNITVVESPEPGNQAKNGSDPSLVIVIAPQTETAGGDGYTKKRSVDDHLPTLATTGTDTDGLTGDKSVAKASENEASQKQAIQAQALDSGTADPYYEPGTTTDRRPKYVSSANDKRELTGRQLVITDGPSSADGVGTDNGARGQKVLRSRPVVTRRTKDDGSADSNDDKRDPGTHPDHVENNNVSLKNGSKNGDQPGKCDSDHDIVSAGSFNNGTVRKGLVEDGTLNNGNMVQYNVNNGTINKGNISGSSADNGIISVGTVNNGPVNYGTSDTYANNGKQFAMNSYDVQQYVSNIDKMYSTILERLG